jgi:hypothetical protein
MPEGFSIQRLRELFAYDPETGNVSWLRDRIGANNSIRARAGDGAGYRQVEVDGRVLQCHRVAWALVTGRWPKCEIDHRNGKRDDNRWENLREATHQQNAHNRRVRKDSASGLKGVSFHRRTGKWQAYIGLAGEQKYLGLFETRAAAHRAYLAAAKERFGAFANDGVRHAR